MTGLGRVRIITHRIFARHVLGLSPDPESWGEPSNIDVLSVPSGIDHTSDQFDGWSLSLESSTHWPHKRTSIGAHAYRFEQNGEYDCGWRLVDVAYRFLVTHERSAFDIVTIVPPPPIFTPTPVLEWSAERLARRLDAAYRPDLFTPSAPLASHADLLRKPPLPLVDLYRLERPASVFSKRVLLSDWRWHKGRCMVTLAKVLVRAGADVTCFTWLE